MRANTSSEMLGAPGGCRCTRGLQLRDDRSAKEDTADASELQLRDGRSARRIPLMRANSSSEMVGAPGGYRLMRAIANSSSEMVR